MRLFLARSSALCVVWYWEPSSKGRDRLLLRSTLSPGFRRFLSFIKGGRSRQIPPRRRYGRNQARGSHLDISPLSIAAAVLAS